MRRRSFLKGVAGAFAAAFGLSKIKTEPPRTVGWRTTTSTAILSDHRVYVALEPAREPLSEGIVPTSRTLTRKNYARMMGEAAARSLDREMMKALR